MPIVGEVKLLGQKVGFGRIVRVLVRRTLLWYCSASYCNAVESKRSTEQSSATIYEGGIHALCLEEADGYSNLSFTVICHALLGERYAEL